MIINALLSDPLPARYCPECGAHTDAVGEVGSECWTPGCGGQIAAGAKVALQTFRIPAGWRLVPETLYGCMEHPAVAAAVSATPNPWPDAFWKAALAHAPEPPHPVHEIGATLAQARENVRPIVEAERGNTTHFPPTKG